MSYGEDVVNRRRGKASSKELATRADLTPGRVWAIEHGQGRPVSASEREAIERALQSIESQPATTRAASTAKRVVVSPRQATNEITAANIPSLSRAGTGVDWSSLRVVADQISDHDYERATIGPDPDAGYRLFSNSELSTFTQCPRRWWLAYWRGLTPKVQSPLGPLAIGDRIHRALRYYYVPTTLSAIDPRESIETIIASDWKKIERRFTPGDPQLDALKAKFTQESNLERVMLEGYVEWITSSGIDEYLTVIGSEMYAESEFDVDDETPVKLIGKIDTRVSRTSDGMHLFLDHKTVANFTGPRATLHMNTQMLHYHIIMNRMTQDAGAHCAGALYNMLRKTMRSNRSRPPYFDRVEVRFNEHTLRSYEQRLRVIIRQILDIESKLRDGVDFKDIIHHNPTSDCAWKCQFFSVCPMHDDSKSYPEAMLAEYYVKHDVYDYYRDQEYTEESE